MLFIWHLLRLILKCFEAKYHSIFFKVITIIVSARVCLFVFLLSKLQQQKKYESKKTKCDHLLQYHSLSSMYLF